MELTYVYGTRTSYLRSLSSGYDVLVDHSKYGDIPCTRQKAHHVVPAAHPAATHLHHVYIISPRVHHLDQELSVSSPFLSYFYPRNGMVQRSIT